MPEVTKYINDLGKLAIGADKIYYVAKCFRNESTTDSERLREFTQIQLQQESGQKFEITFNDWDWNSIL